MGKQEQMILLGPKILRICEISMRNILRTLVTYAFLSRVNFQQIQISLRRAESDCENIFQFSKKNISTAMLSVL